MLSIKTGELSDVIAKFEDTKKELAILRTSYAKLQSVYYINYSNIVI
jgi:hypothetical protein